MPTLGCTVLLHRPCEHVYVYIFLFIYICSRYESREQFAFPRVGGKPEQSLSGRNHPTMQSQPTVTGPMEFQIEQLKKKIAEKAKEILKVRAETERIEKKRKNAEVEKERIEKKQERHRDEEKAEDMADEEELCAGCPSCWWGAELEKEYEKKEIVIVSDADDVVAPGSSKNR